MKFEFKKECSVQNGQKLWGVIASTVRGCNGICPVVVHDIDWRDEIIIFKTEQPRVLVSCSFEEMSKLVWETEEEAKAIRKNIPAWEGMHNYMYSY